MAEKEGERKKWCPIEKGWCGEEEVQRCALAIDLKKVVMGQQAKVRQCVFGALVVLLSEINLKTGVGRQAPQVLNIPKLYRG